MFFFLLVLFSFFFLLALETKRKKMNKVVLECINKSDAIASLRFILFRLCNQRLLRSFTSFHSQRRLSIVTPLVLLNASPYRTDFVFRSAPFRRLNASPYRTDFVFNLGKYISFFSKTYITIANVICNEVYQNV